jgi:hypothetical protein
MRKSKTFIVQDHKALLRVGMCRLPRKGLQKQEKGQKEAFHIIMPAQDRC